MDDFATGYLAGQDGGNNNGGFFGNEGLWAVIILAIIFGWGTNGYGRNGGDNGMNAYIPYLVGTGATGQGGNDTRAALSEGFYQQDTSRSLAGIQSGICSLGYDQLAQMPQTARHISTGIALLISKRKRESVFRRPPLIILRTDYPKSIWSLDAATDRL